MASLSVGICSSGLWDQFPEMLLHGHQRNSQHQKLVSYAAFIFVERSIARPVKADELSSPEFSHSTLAALGFHFVHCMFGMLKNKSDS
jgi:hypothetical protein